jgi:prolyl oligopeptidase
VVFEGSADDVAVSAGTMFRPEGSTTFVSRRLNFFEGEVHLLGPDGPRRVPFPTTADVDAVFQGQVLATLRKSWRGFPAGAVVSMPLDRLDEEAAALVRAPGDRSTITGVSTSRDAVYLQTLENVTPRLLPVRREGAAWRAGAGTDASVVSTDPFASFVYVRREDFLTPTSVWREPPGAEGPLKSLPSRFDAAGLEWKQFEATSADGTRVPYFLVSRKNLPLDGTTPTLLYGYGGFEISLTPQYLGALGKVWLGRGGAYVLANIRGGGEFGPRWHQAALRENRPRAFEDFVAVAEDLLRGKVTSPRRLGIMGGSNGGLLVGAAFTRRPDLFRAVVCQVPLLDMMRYHKLLAGASWRAEYGDPDDPAAAASIRSWSPYQNLRAGAAYPKVFFVTSTKDDRVHPGHARKAVARMEELGHDVLYFENIEGGHGAAANLEQRVKKSALEYVYLFRQLVD